MIRKFQLALVLLAIVSIVSALGGYRLAVAAPAPRPIDVAPQPIHPVPIHRATLPPLPFASPTAAPSGAATTAPATSGIAPPGIPAGIPAVTGWTINKSLKLPPHVPKLSQFLMSSGKGRYAVRQVRTGSTARMAPMLHLSGSRSVRAMGASSGARVAPMAGDGSTILLTGDQTNFFENDITLSYGQEIYVLCENMATTDRVYYVAFPPDGSGPYVSSQIRVYSDGSGNNYCGNYGQFNLSTPFSGFGGSTVSGTAYPGVWVIATYDANTGQYTSETNIIASSSVNFSTYSDVAESNPTTDFTQGSVIAVGATGLNPSHYYAVGWVYTSGGGQPCSYSVPTGNSSNVV
ncbi:MAG TPA: hypothetical protein VFN49_05675, partial [Candidatus Aquilonibacter sp.]|nr:hypothetical protein [Candidatus Aquilonibacter sp.]